MPPINKCVVCGHTLYTTHMSLCASCDYKARWAIANAEDPYLKKSKKISDNIKQEDKGGKK